jgi:hypothetical protein
MEGESAKAEANGAVRHGGIIHSESGTETERKFKDPNGQIFDLTGPEYARDFWRVAV